MWLVKRLADERIVSAQLNQPPVEEGHEVFEWFDEYEVFAVGVTLPDGTEVPEVYGVDPRPAGYVDPRGPFDDLGQQLNNEIAFLEGILPQVESMNMAEALAFLKRLGQQNLATFKAFKLLHKKL